MLYIVDDEKDIRSALKWVADSKNITCKTCASGEELFDAINVPLILDEDEDEDEDIQLNPKFDPAGDCIILDIRMPGISGITAFEILTRYKMTGRMPVIFISGHGHVAGAVSALKHGAFDFFEKPFDDTALFNQVLVSLEKSQRESDIFEKRRRFETLTEREREVLDLILIGKMNKVIGDALGISMRTVEVHRANILEKTGVKTALELSALIR